MKCDWCGERIAHTEDYIRIQHVKHGELNDEEGTFDEVNND